MFTQFFGLDDEKEKQRRRNHYEDFVGSRFMMRISHELQMASRRLTQAVPRSRATMPLAPKTSFSSKNPVYVEEKTAQPRPGVTSAMLHVAVPGYDMNKHGKGLATRKPDDIASDRLCCKKILIVFFSLIVVFSVIIGLAVSPAFVKEATLATNAPTQFAFATSPPTLVTARPTASPTVSTSRPTSAGKGGG